MRELPHMIPLRNGLKDCVVVVVIESSNMMDFWVPGVPGVASDGGVAGVGVVFPKLSSLMKVA